MPLAFESISHGTIPFGFFNIETDMLLLDRYSFFLTNFCELLNKIFNNETDTFTNWEVFQFKTKNSIGDLHASIANKSYKGFIGEVYKIYPFPFDLSLFKQQTYGCKNQKIILPIIEKYAKKTTVRVSAKLKTKTTIEIGRYKFDLKVFKKMLHYTITGGYPKWEKAKAPDYIINLKQKILNNKFLKS